MAKAPRNNVDDTIDEADGVGAAVNPADGEVVEEQAQPSYRVFKDARIPISKQAGKIWKSRHDTGRAKMKGNGSIEAWDEAIRYYKNDQTGKRRRDNPDLGGNTSATNDATGGLRTNTENVVFSNISALVPSIYAKNPDVSIHSPKGDADLPFTVCAQRLIRTLMQKRTSPGINLKPKMRRNVVIATLTNIGYIECGYTRREVSNEATLAEIDAVALRLQNAKDKKEVVECEGILQALEDKVDLLQPSGPWCVFRNPKDVIMDPDASMIDGTDSNWMMIRDVFETSFLNAVYREKDEETGEYKSLYKPTHVLKANTDASTNMAGHDMDITNFELIKDNEHDYKNFGFDNEDAYRRAGRTFVWKIWDKTTRRVYMFAENDWAWPIWVWDDPYGFDDFFPISPLSFHTDPEDMYARGEASYYLDQQDEINDINSQVSRMRQRIANTLVYDKNKIKDVDDVMKLLRPANTEQAVGVNVPEGMKIADMLSAPPVPAVGYEQLFDKKSLFDAIDRTSGVPSVVKGVEFRTNTTNKAIDSYESTSAQRLDEKIDAIEECIGRVGYMILVMCLQFMTKEEVVGLIGDEDGKVWPGPLGAKEAQTRFSLTVTGGSSLKPTSKNRKEQAKEAAQILGQFGAQNPAILLVVIKMFARAYSDEMVLAASDWAMIMQSIEGAMQQQNAPAEAPPPANGNEPPPEQQGADPREIIKMVSEMFKKMPEKIRQGVGQEIAEGVPLEKILQKLQHLQGAGGGAPTQAPPQQAAE